MQLYPSSPINVAEIRVEHVQKRFGSFFAVRDSSFVVKDGEFLCLLGPSGCGKTTTLRMIAGLELPTSGRIFLDGYDVTSQSPSRRDIAFVFQMFALYPHLSVRSNIAFPLESQGVSAAEIKRRVEQTAVTLRIGHLLSKSVSALSGGDRQRVALGRAIIRQPKAFLMDEPLGALDAEFRHIMCGELRSIHNRLKATTVYVTHDQAEAMSMADRIAIMNQGEVEQLASPQEIYDEPATTFVAGFIGFPAMNLIPCTAQVAINGSFANQVLINGVSVSIGPYIPLGGDQQFIIGVRPEHVYFSEQSPLRARVYGSEYLGTMQIVTLILTDEQTILKARLRSDLEVFVGEHVGIGFTADKVSIFSASDGKAVTCSHQTG